MSEEKTALDLWNEEKTKAYRSANVQWFAEKLAEYAKELEAKGAQMESSLYQLWVEIKCPGEEPALNPHYIVGRAINELIELRNRIQELDDAYASTL